MPPNDPVAFRMPSEHQFRRVEHDRLFAVDREQTQWHCDTRASAGQQFWLWNPS
jgi:hypothetical protein